MNGSRRHVFGAWEGTCWNDPHLASAPPRCGIPALAPREEKRRTSPNPNPNPNLLATPAPRGAPRSLCLRERAVRQRHRVAAQHQSAAALPAPRAAQPSPARDLLGGGTAVEGISSSTTPVPVFLHILASRSGSRQRVQEWTEQGQCPLPALAWQLSQPRSRSRSWRRLWPASSCRLQIAGLERTGLVNAVTGSSVPSRPPWRADRP